jgi:YegS/Rv2252/BmrU family lipid kinase
VKYKFVVNRHAGGGISQGEISRLENFFQRQIGSFDVTLPDNRDDAIEKTRRAIKEGAEKIVSVGGDGTTNTVMNGFFENGKPINPNATLVVSKTGSGFDYYRSVVSEKPPKSWMELVTNHEPRAVDAGFIEYENASDINQYFINMSSVGVTADIIQRKDVMSKRIPRIFSYIIPTVQSVFTFKPVGMDIVTENESFSVNALAVTVAKGTYAGGGMKFGLNAKLDDGLFDITVIEEMSVPSLAYNLAKLYSGDFTGVKKVRKLKASRIEIRTERPIQVEFDGELHGTTNIKISCLPKAINVAFPV